VRVTLRARISVGEREFLFESPQAYMRLDGKLSYGKNEVWISLEGSSISIDVRKLSGRTILHPDVALRELRELMNAAKELASSGYTVSLRMRGLKIMTFG